MFLSPLNWHFAKFTAFEWHQAKLDLRERPSDNVPHPRSTAPAAPGRGVEPRVPADVVDR